MIYIKGYADKGTGNPYVNRKYAKQRAENVKKALINKYGIDAKMIPPPTAPKSTVSRMSCLAALSSSAIRFSPMS